jgi:hypothetical protein
MTLEDVARACSPPTTPQTIGRLETGTRTVSVGWLNRIAAALGVDSADLVDHPRREDLELLAVLGPSGATAPRRAAHILPPRTHPGQVGIRVDASVGEYRAGDELWCDRVNPDSFAAALNRDVLAPRPGGRFLFGRLLGRDGAKLHILPLGAGARQSVIADPPWLAVAARLVRTL